MDRPDVITLPSDTIWLTDPAVQAVCAAVSAKGAEVYFVGGCVRDGLLRLGGSDIDLATNALPQEVMELARAAGLRAVPTGIDHGTVTVVSDGRGFEITTFRKDVETDGRHATVSFSNDIAEDAARRDFTMNALYATPQGRVLDPLDGGIADCLARRVRFIEDAARRIEEDYLRILRYYRFHAWYAPPELGFEPDTLDAIAGHLTGLETLSAERTGAETMRLLAAVNPAPAVASMRQTGVLAAILPGSDDRFLAPLCHLEETVNRVPDPVLRLAALGGENQQDRLRLSRSQMRRLALLQDLSFAGASLEEISYRHGSDVAECIALLRAAYADQPLRKSDFSDIELGEKATFPISAQDLMPALTGKALGDRLKELEARWIASRFTLSRDELMAGK